MTATQMLYTTMRGDPSGTNNESTIEVLVVLISKVASSELEPSGLYLMRYLMTSPESGGSHEMV